MSVNEKMTQLADEVRELSGTADKLGIDEMINDVATANEEVNEQADLIAEIMAKVESLPAAGGGSGLQGVEFEITSNITDAMALRYTLFHDIKLGGWMCAVLTKAKNNEVVNNQVLYAFFAYNNSNGGTNGEYGFRIRDGKYTSISLAASYDVGVTIGDIYTIYDLGEIYGN